MSGRVLKIDAVCAAPSEAYLWAVSVMRTDGGANEAPPRLLTRAGGVRNEKTKREPDEMTCTFITHLPFKA